MPPAKGPGWRGAQPELIPRSSRGLLLLAAVIFLMGSRGAAPKHEFRIAELDAWLGYESRLPGTYRSVERPLWTRQTVESRRHAAKHRFHVAIQEGDLERIRMELDAGLDLTFHKYHEYLELAACEGSAAVAEVIFGGVVHRDSEFARRVRNKRKIMSCAQRRNDREVAAAVFSVWVPPGWNRQQVAWVLESGELEMLSRDPAEASLRHGGIELARSFGIDSEKLSEWWRTKIGSAIAAGKRELVEERLFEARELTSRDLDALVRLAVENDQADILRLLLEEGAQVTTDDMDRVVDWQNPALASVFIEFGVEPVELMRRSFRRSDNRRLVWWLYSGYLDPESRGESELWQMEERDQALLLLDAGVDPFFYTHPDQYGVSGGDKRSAQFLSRGLWAAIAKGDEALERLYLDAGASLRDLDASQLVVSENRELLLKELAERGEFEALAAARQQGLEDPLSPDGLSSVSSIFWDRYGWMEYFIEGRDGDPLADFQFFLPEAFDESCPPEGRQWSFICDSTLGLEVRGRIESVPWKRLQVHLNQILGGRSASAKKADVGAAGGLHGEIWRRTIRGEKAHFLVTLQVEGPEHNAPEVDSLAHTAFDRLKVPEVASPPAATKMALFLIAGFLLPAGLICWLLVWFRQSTP